MATQLTTVDELYVRDTSVLTELEQDYQNLIRVINGATIAMHHLNQLRLSESKQEQLISYALKKFPREFSLPLPVYLPPEGNEAFGRRVLPFLVNEKLIDYDGNVIEVK